MPGLLSLLVPGSGQLACGLPLRGAAWFAGDLILTAALLRSVFWIPADRWNLPLPLAAYAAFRVAAVVDAVRASRGRRPALLARPLVALALAAAWFWAGIPPFAHLLYRHVAATYSIPTGGMTPTLVPGDRVLADPHPRGAPERFEVWIYDAPSARGDLVSYVHRVVGMPGETVELKSGAVFIDGARLDEPGREVDAPCPDWGPQQVPAGHFWLLGDRRAASVDSRAERLGFVPLARLRGRARVVYASAFPEREGVRWDRVGMIVR